MSDTNIISDILTNFKGQHGLLDDIVKESAERQFAVKGGSPIEQPTTILRDAFNIPREDFEAIMATEKPELSMITDELKLLDDEIASLNDAVKTRKQRVDELEYKLKQFLEENGMESSRVNGISFSLSHKMGWQVEDWDKVWAWIHGTGNTQVVTKKLKSTALDELLEHGDLPPFIVPKPYTDLSRRKY